MAVAAAAAAAAVRPRGRLMLARPCRASEPTKRADSAVHAAAVVEASGAAVGEEHTVDYEKLGNELEIASPLEIIDRALEMFGNEIAIAFRLRGVISYFMILAKFLFSICLHLRILFCFVY